MIRSVLALWVGLCLVGCQGGAPAANEAVKEMAKVPTSAELLHSQLSSGSYQVGAALDTLEKAHDLGQTLLKPGPLQDAMKDVSDLLDSAGRSLADISQETPTVATIEGSFGAFDDARLAAIAAGNDALHDINEAQGILNSILEDMPPADQSKALELRDTLTAAIDDLIGTIEAYGGQVENN